MSDNPGYAWHLTVILAKQGVLHRTWTTESDGGDPRGLLDSMSRLLKRVEVGVIADLPPCNGPPRVETPLARIDHHSCAQCGVKWPTREVENRHICWSCVEKSAEKKP